MQHKKPETPGPAVIAWETTRRCNLKCRHCRGAARDATYEGELTTEECFSVIDSIASFASPVLILTGGEPMMRPDIFPMAKRASDKGMHVVMAPCGHMITPESAEQMKDAGIRAISISLDGATPEQHDAFRGVRGAYERTLEGLKHASAAGIPFQVNTTVTRKNVDDLPAILAHAVELGAKTLDLFFLVPTGRGSAIRDLELSAEAHEKALRWIYQTSLDAPIRVKTTCAPHYARIQRETTDNPPSQGLRRGKRSSDPQLSAFTPHPSHPSGGCMAGKGFVFISHRGILQGCGFLDVPAGDLRAVDYDFRRAYQESNVFKALRDPDTYKGKCGACEFRRVCGGCRARAFGHTGDYLDEEPSCVYIPHCLREG